MRSYGRTALPFSIDVDALGAVVEITEQEKSAYNQNELLKRERIRARDRVKRKKYRATHQQQIREYWQEYAQRPEVKEKRNQKAREYQQRPEVKARRNELRRQRRARKKAEKEQQANATQSNI